MRNFFAQIPKELEESARIDGANDITVLVRIILPLSMAVLATIGLFHMVGHWNEWFTGIIYIRDRKKLPVQIILRNISRQATQQHVFYEGGVPEESTPPSIQVQMAMTVVTAFPIIAVYPFLQKHFTKGVLLGSIKG
jgi:ABC-type glycerol-3-phosphate transport system permease component